MNPDIRIISKFIHNYFHLQSTVPYHKIYLISKNIDQPKKYMKFVNKNVKIHIKERIQAVPESVNEIYSEHKWLLKMLDIFYKLFGNIEKIKKIVKYYFKRKISKHKQEIIKEVVINYNYYGNTKESQNTINKKCEDDLPLKILEIIHLYDLDLITTIETALISNFIDNNVLKIRLLKDKIYNISTNIFNIKDKLINRIVEDIDKQEIILYLRKKLDLEFIDYLYKDNPKKYIEIINEYIEETVKRFESEEIENTHAYKRFKYNKKDEKTADQCHNTQINYNSKLSAHLQDISKYTNILIETYKDYKLFDGFIKSVYLKYFTDLNINTEKILEYLNYTLIHTDTPHTCLYQFINFLFTIIQNKEHFEYKIREGMCLRLLNYNTLEKEITFFKELKNNLKEVLIYKIKNILEDYKKREIFHNSEITLLRKFQWVNLEKYDIEIEELNEIKTKYVDKIAKHEKKHVYWLDNLSSVEVEINGATFVMTVIQYDILRNIIYNESKHKSFKSKEDTITQFVNNLLKKKDIRLEDIYKKELICLIEKGFIILEKDEFYVNVSCESRNLVNYDIKPVRIQDVKDRAVNSMLKTEVINSKIMKILKYHKEVEISDLLDEMDFEESDIRKSIQELEKKGYLSVEKDKLKYIP